MLEVGRSYERVERKKGWVDETAQLGSSASDWLKEYFLSGPDDRESYESGELLYGGGFSEVVEALVGGATVKNVRVEYRKDVPREASIRLRSGQEIAVKGKALADLLALQEASVE